MDKVYSVLDRKLKEFGALVVCPNDEALRRSLIDGVRGSGSLLEKHPDDFDVYCVGSFDADTGVLKGENVPLLVENVGVILGGG